MKGKGRVGLRLEILLPRCPQEGKRLDEGLEGEHVSVDPERLGLEGAPRRREEESQVRSSVQQLLQERRAGMAFPLPQTSPNCHQVCFSARF